jgi:tRNA A-37 threonylcarbamoyl transferase component Bud32
VTTPNDPTMSHSSLDAVIAAYMLAVEAGDVPNREELLEQHAAHAEALRAFFANVDRMDRVASPLRLADGVDVTNVVGADDQSALPTVRYFGDYELLEEIARGGMGIVYKARQFSLNRIVALKMILRDTFATEKDVARFRAEAEAAANLDHPHIVPIYEVGEHEGHEYYAMKFVEGTSLAKHPRSDPRGEVEGIVTVIRAVHHAHLRGVLHRDLKPSNVLVDSQRRRFVTDFGLAKRLADTDASFTETGQVLGTPKYMPPEQAAGRKDLTVAAVVYSLGVILFERLTGQTPFTGDNALTLLRQVRESEPPRPSSIRAGLDRDVETVVLKCLEKEPVRRYSSAEALADDLDRWLRREPIAARPVGRLEKTWLWARRNPAMATAAGLAAATLVTVAVISSIAAAQARALAKAERQGREDAIAARDSVEGALARSYMSPLNVDNVGFVLESDDMLTIEANALWQLAENPGERTWLRFIDLGIRDPFARKQLHARLEPAMIAAVGLDWTRRDRAAKLLTDRFLDPTLPVKRRNEVVNVALELECCAETLREDCAEILSAVLADNSRDYDLVFKAVERLDLNAVARKRLASIEGNPSAHLARELVAVAELLGPSQAAKLCSGAAQVLTAALEKGQDLRVKDDLADGIAAITDKMEPNEAALMLVTLLERSEYNRWKFALALSSVASRMQPAAAANACKPVAKMLAKELEKFEPLDKYLGGVGTITGDYRLASALAGVAVRLEPAEGKNLCTSVARQLGASIERNPRHGFAKALETVAKLADPSQAAKICGRAAQALAAAGAAETDEESRERLEAESTLLAKRLEPAEAAKLLAQFHRTLAARLEEETIPVRKSQIALRLAAVASSTKPADAAQAMIAMMTDGSFGGPSREWTSILISIARRMTPVEADYVCSEVMRLYLKHHRSGHHEISFLLSQVEASKARSLARVLAQLLCSEHDRTSAAIGGLGGHTDLDAVLSNADRLRAPTWSELTDGVLRGIPVAPIRSLSCRLTTQELVDLLKMPTCFGAARRVVIEHLGTIHGRRFANHWEFVRFARAQGLNLDFTTPPKRPDPKESIGHMLKILDGPKQAQRLTILIPASNS